mmetsp:Transcript_6559/g.12000  ORF Transcript_6559/g.12000 Transcript_6559/m.12000 type:complete len:219 (-) Transcript_6559:9-665(-)
MQNLAVVARERTEERAVTVHNNEAILLVTLQKLAQSLGVELIVAEIKRRVDGLERLEVDVQLLFFAVVCHDGSCVHNQSIRRNLIVQLETLLRRGDSAQHGQTVHPTLNVRGCAVFVSKHLRNTRHLILWRYHQTNHGRSVASRSLQGFNKLLYLPYLNLRFCFVLTHPFSVLKGETLTLRVSLLFSFPRFRVLRRCGPQLLALSSSSRLLSLFSAGG